MRRELYVLIMLTDRSRPTAAGRDPKERSFNFFNDALPISRFAMQNVYHVISFSCAGLSSLQPLSTLFKASDSATRNMDSECAFFSTSRIFS